MKAVVTSLNEVKKAMDDVINQNNILLVVADLRSRVEALEQALALKTKPAAKQPKEYKRSPAYRDWLINAMSDGEVHSCYALHKPLAEEWLRRYNVAPTVKDLANVLSNLAAEGKIQRVANLHYQVRKA